MCDWNTSFTPSTSWPYPVGNEDYPVVFVDWCDADAFCKWANKRICGAIDGGTLAFSDYANAGADQHYYACSHDGTLAYPYGNTWSPTTCNGANAGHGELLPVASLSGCNGGFPGVFDLVGNAEEWQDSCNGTTGATDNCLDGPESYAFPSADAGAAGARCDFLDDDLRSSHLPDVGIRCCSP